MPKAPTYLAVENGRMTESLKAAMLSAFDAGTSTVGEPPEVRLAALRCAEGMAYAAFNLCDERPGITAGEIMATIQAMAHNVSASNEGAAIN